MNKRKIFKNNNKKILFKKLIYKLKNCYNLLVKKDNNNNPRLKI